MITPSLRTDKDQQYPSLPRLLQFHYEHNPEQPLFIYDGHSDSDDLTEIKYLEFIRASHRASHLIRPPGSGVNRQVVAVVALLDTLVYTAVVAGLMQAGLVPLLISPRNTSAAVVDILKKSGAHRLLGTQSTLGELFQNIQAELASYKDNGKPYELVIEEIPSLTDLFPKLGVETAKDPFKPYPYPSSSYPGPEDIAAILHSSGSTGFPKPIPLNYRFLNKSWVISHSTKRFGQYGNPLGAYIPPFHVMAFVGTFLGPIYLGYTVTVYAPVVTHPRGLPTMPTPDNVLEHVRRTHCTACFSVPAMIQIWAQSPESIDVLRGLKLLVTAGGPIAQSTGDYLVSCGVPLRNIYGGTEFGACSNWSMEDDDKEDWAWHQFDPRTTKRWVPQGDGTFELQFLSTDEFPMGIENLPDVPGYATSDLFTPHPTKPGLWSIVGRIDDVIIHSSGEKTVPTPFEEMVRASPLVMGVLMFGRQRDQPGVLLEPSAEAQIDDVSDQSQMTSFRNKIWPVIEEGNKLLPAFSKIYKEMILITSPNKPLPRAGKGTILRKAALKEYEKEIDQIYEIVESNAGTVEPPTNWELSMVQDWLTTQVEELCHNSVNESDDIFEHGFDSLSATILRLRLVNSLRATGNTTASRMISQNVVYNYPTIAKLSQFIVALIESPENGVAAKSHEAVIEDMISIYSKGLDAPLPESNANSVPSTTVVLLTGSTGNLGAQILATLLSTESVSKVYTLNRPSSKLSIEQRHKERFEDKGLNSSLLSSKKLVLLEGESSQPKLGLTDVVYGQLQESLTLVIHNAWRLDFNLSLSSFEPHIRGTRNLIDLARSSRYASSLGFMFTSSIGSAQSWNSSTMGPYPEKVISDPKYAVGPGYGESKYVSERILAKSGLHASSFRIGQITGGQNGAWAMSDWLPMIIKSSLVLNVLPDTTGVVSFIPMDAVAGTILDVAFASEHPPLAINLVHPKPVSWTSIISAIRESLISIKSLPLDALPLVTFKKWVEALEDASNASPERVSNEFPAYKIVDFIRAMAANEGQNVNAKQEALGGSVFETLNIQRVSKCIQELSPLGRADAELWVKYWVKCGL